MSSGPVKLRALVDGVPTDLPAVGVFGVVLPLASVNANGVIDTIAGHLLGKASIATQAVDDTNSSILATSAYIAVQSLTQPRTLTLPAAAAYPQGQPLYIADESGSCSAIVPITVASAGSDTIAGQPSIQMASPYQKLTFHSNGTNLWTYA